MVGFYLDDVREPPLSGEWIVARNFEEAILAYARNHLVISTLSLDHDLGEVATGLDFLRWLERSYPKDLLDKAIIVHSANPVGKARMQNFISDFLRSNPYGYTP